MMLTGILKMSLRLKTSLYLLQARSSSGPSQTKVSDHFVNMVAKTIPEHGLEDADSILETLLLYNALESSPPEQHSLPELYSPPEQLSCP
ncbi:hypothetical protein RchiOBHm_Chr1g0323151 [Rosa chinensis]|uniref:Uncharacterized protein n=1 Tax=Rosa chinensis TaxID=74649 RepID=A0A2P6S9D2_ROSCH|nr:hypothetical protein RchiOBHm_Chr1g0323151 [Rosa chinensis]